MTGSSICVMPLQFFRNEVFVDAIKSCRLCTNVRMGSGEHHAARAAPAALIRLYELLKNDSRSSLQAPLRVPSDRTGQRTPLPGGLSRKWACADRFVALGGVCGLGGGERDRTDDPLLAKQVLSQLSYTPLLCVCALWWVWLDSNQRPPPYQDGALTD